MIRFLRYDKNVPREDDGAVRIDDFIDEFKVKFVGTSQRTVDAQEVLSLILHCKSMYGYRMTLLSTSTTSGTLSNCTPFSKVD